MDINDSIEITERHMQSIGASFDDVRTVGGVKATAGEAAGWVALIERTERRGEDFHAVYATAVKQFGHKFTT